MLAGWRDAVADAPDELSTVGFIWTLPVVPELPEHLRGLTYVGVGGMWAGDPADGERATRPLRELATPLIDMSKTTPYLELQRELDPYFPAGLRYYWKALYLDGLLGPRDRGDGRLVEPPPVGAHAGGHPPLRRRDPPGRRRGDRLRRPQLGVDAEHRLDLGRPGRRRGQHRLDARLLGRLPRFSHGQTYFNFPGLLEEGDSAVRASYGANHARLARIKAQYDPENLFRLNQNIRPEASPEPGRALLG